MTNEMSDLVVVGGAKQYILSCRMPLNKTHPPGVASQSLLGLGEVLLDPTNRDVPDLHLWAHVPNCEDLEGKGQRELQSRAHSTILRARRDAVIIKRVPLDV